MTIQPDAEFDLDADVDEIDLATGSGFPKMDDIEGCLLLMWPIKAGTRPSKERPGEEYTWIETDCIVLQAPADAEGNPGEGKMPSDFFTAGELPVELLGFQFSGAQVTAFLEQKMRKKVFGLGVLLRGEVQRNRTAPWELHPPTPDQLQIALRYRAQVKAAARAKAAKAAAQQAATGEVPAETAAAGTANPWG